ncbi:M48 family metalloprotease [Quadrisphaera setariae]|uniref:M48 family metalloprotease n=1 Tax=Quadrisphaera setariae TaxID=2593304 RepID=A0A5C8ZGP9_9ACTN|nr:M48 family metalloprotease [Quadrisphaera setariae]TXR57092.1 M48 family metalloprotease [Quadrisphaera setariae]
MTPSVAAEAADVLYALQAPLVASVLLALGAPLVARRCPPRAATLVLAACAVVSSAVTALVLVLHLVVLLARLPVVAGLVGYDAERLAHHVPVPPAASALAVALLAAGVVRALALSRRRRQALRAADDLCSRLGGPAGGVIVVDDGAEAFALPSRGGRVVVSRALMDALPGPEQAALLAHERAHLRDHHDVLRAATAWSAALDPLLVGLPRSVRYASERWADESAVAALGGDRPLVARAVARAGLVRTSLAGRTAWRSVALAGGEGDVVQRVRALLARRPGSGRPLVAAGALCLAVLLAAGGHAVEDTAEVLQHVLSGGNEPDSGLATVDLVHEAGHRALEVLAR